jgi:hypothetical protein
MNPNHNNCVKILANRFALVLIWQVCPMSRVQIIIDALYFKICEMNWSNLVMIRLIETIVIKIDRSCLLTVQGSTIEIYYRSCLIDPVTILVMCQLWFEFVHSLNRLS